MSQLREHTTDFQRCTHPETSGPRSRRRRGRRPGLIGILVALPGEAGRRRLRGSDDSRGRRRLEDHVQRRRPLHVPELDVEEAGFIVFRGTAAGGRRRRPVGRRHHREVVRRTSPVRGCREAKESKSIFLKLYATPFFSLAIGTDLGLASTVFKDKLRSPKTRKVGRLVYRLYVASGIHFHIIFVLDGEGGRDGKM